MARYRVLEKSFINNHLVEANAEVDYDGEPGTNLQPLDAPEPPAPVKAKKEKAAVDSGDALV